MAIDFNSRIPYYVQLIDMLRSEIEGGSWKQGDRLPGELELCETYGISRTVVRQALRELELEGLIYRKKGKGSFVAEPKVRENMLQQIGLLEWGREPTVKVLNMAIELTGAKAAKNLEIEVGAPVIWIERLRSVDGEPRILVSSYVPYELCPGLEHLDLTDKSIFVIMEEQYGLQIARGRRDFEAVIADEREAELIGIEVGAPLMLVDSVSYLADGRPVEFSHAVHRGDRSRFEVEVVRTQDLGQVKQILGAAEEGLPVSIPQSVFV